MIVKSLEHLNSLSRKIADRLVKNDCIFLIGEIGVGKTTFTRYLINYLQEKNGEKITEVLSPTFNLLYEYDLNNIKIMHYDLYRIKDESELKHLDEKVATLHLGKVGAKLTKMSKEQADYISVKPSGPFKPDTYRY